MNMYRPSLQLFISCLCDMGASATGNMAMQEKRHQMMNDVKALCEVDDPGLVRFVGAYHAPENGQARPRCGNPTSVSALLAITVTVECTARHDCTRAICPKRPAEAVVIAWQPPARHCMTPVRDVCRAQASWLWFKFCTPISFPAAVPAPYLCVSGSLELNSTPGC